MILNITINTDNPKEVLDLMRMLQTIAPAKPTRWRIVRWEENAARIKCVKHYQDFYQCGVKEAKQSTIDFYCDWKELPENCSVERWKTFEAKMEIAGAEIEVE
jgi:ribosomal protein L7/L12